MIKRTAQFVASTSLLFALVLCDGSPQVGATSAGGDDPTWSALPSLDQIISELTIASATNTLTPTDLSGLQVGEATPDAEENGSQKNCEPNDEVAYSFAPCVYGDVASNRVIVVVGDSEADMWIPTFDIYGKEFGFKIVRLVMDGCTPWKEAVPKSFQGWTACEVKWKSYCISEVNKLRPYAVVAAGMLRDSQASVLVANPEKIAAGIDKYFSAIKKSGAKLFVLSNIPWDYAISTTPNECVDVHNADISACDAKIDPTMAQALNIVQQNRIATVIPVDSLFCKQLTCPVVDGEVVLYADNHHMSHAWATTIPRAFSQILNPLLGIH